MEYEVSAVEPRDAYRFLPQMEEYLLPAIERAGQYELADIYAQITNEESWLFIATEDGAPIGAAVVAMEVYPRRKYLLLHLLGGTKAKEWAPILVDRLRTLAKGLGFYGVRVEGRKGWTKIFPEATQESVVLTLKAGD